MNRRLNFTNNSFILDKKGRTMKEFPEKLEGDGIKLRRIKPTFELATEVFAIVDRNREHLGQWLPWVACNRRI